MASKTSRGRATHCEATGKRSYHTARIARAEARRITKLNSDTGLEFTSYVCRLCGDRHLTTQERDDPRTAIDKADDLIPFDSAENAAAWRSNVAELCDG